MKASMSILLVALLCSCSGENIEQKTAQSLPVNTTTQTHTKEASMFSLFGKKELKNYYVSSPLQGTLVKGGKPMANTKIIRRLMWNDNDEGVFDEFTTDENGYFDIPAHQVELALGMVQFVGKIGLFSESAKEDNQDTNLMWYSVKYSAEIYSDTEKPLEGVVCEMKNDQVRVELKETAVLTRCTWNDMPKEMDA